MSDVSDTSPEEHPASITPVRTVTARALARETAAILREVADEGHAFAVQHFGRVIGFLVPREGHEVVKRSGKVSYEVPGRQPLPELDEAETRILEVLSEGGLWNLERLLPHAGSFGELATALGKLEMARPRLAVKVPGGYRITEEGQRTLLFLGRPPQ